MTSTQKTVAAIKGKGDEQMQQTERVREIRVANHIHELEREAAEVRAERDRRATATPRETGWGARQRVGRWLIGVGVAIGGRSADATIERGDPMANAV
jgi:hypothetical protein